MISMDTTFVNQELEVAAKRTLTHITGSEDTLKPLYLQPDRALFLAENPGIIFKVYLTGKALQREYAIAQTKPVYSRGRGGCGRGDGALVAARPYPPPPLFSLFERYWAL